jgi:hypothetical protein
MHVRRCPVCGEEYRAEIVRCADCGVVLQDADDEVVPFEERLRPASLSEGGPPPERKVPEGYVLVYKGRDVGDVELLAEGLRQAGVPWHVHHTPAKPDGSPAAYDLMVPEAEAPRARRALAPLLGDGADPEAVDRSFDAEAGYLRCPACSSEMPPGAKACPDCGLAVIAETDGEDEP